MSDLVRIELLPLGKILQVERGLSLQEFLFAEGVEFPCGGKGRCKGCRIKVISGALPVTEEDLRCLRPEEIGQGWRLACRARVQQDLVIDLAQWEAPILADNSIFAFTPRPGLGVAIDLGTTTLVAQLLDLQNGHVLAVRTGLNAQAQHGADIMSRVEYAISGQGLDRLALLIRSQIGALIRELLDATKLPAEKIKDVVLVGNTVMHHLFCGLDVKPLAHVPFEPNEDGLQLLETAKLGWKFLTAEPTVRFLPCLGGFVGSDILAGVLSAGLHKNTALTALIDLGTNGEIVVGNRERMLCASTAAGPAFEGARISMGMRAATGAISEVKLEEGKMVCRVLGGGEPRGICGSGLVDAIAAGLELGWINPAGRLANGMSISLAEPVNITQGDIRELQLAKGAVAAGLKILVQNWGAEIKDLSCIYLAGAFGNYINRTSAQRIGLIDFPPDKVLPAGNTALLGAKLALANHSSHNGRYPEVLSRIQHVSLHEDPQFQETYVDEMRFPEK